MDAVIVFVSIMCGGFLGMFAGVALAMYKYGTDDSNDDKEIIINCNSCNIYDDDIEIESEDASKC